jgi:hypothetical protein
MEMSYVCPVCGFNLDDAPYSFGGAKYIICDCCETEFGNDDGGVYLDGSKVYQQLRDKWIEAGAKWRYGVPPSGWSWREQVRWLNEHPRELDEWVQMAVFNRFPYEDGVAADGSVFAVRDGRHPAITEESPPKLRQPAEPTDTARLREYLVVSRDAVHSKLAEGWSIGRPVSLLAPGDVESPRTGERTGRLCEFVAPLAGQVREGLLHAGVPISGGPGDLALLDAILERPREWDRLVKITGDVWGTDRMLGFGGMVCGLVATHMGGECHADDADIRREWTLSVTSAWGRVYPAQRAYKRLASGSEWSLYSYGVGLGMIPLPANESLMVRG